MPISVTSAPLFSVRDRIRPQRVARPSTRRAGPSARPRGSASRCALGPVGADPLGAPVRLLERMVAVEAVVVKARAAASASRSRHACPYASPHCWTVMVRL